jgi:hypothetical protein
MIGNGMPSGHDPTGEDRFSEKSWANKKLEHDGDSAWSHHAPACCFDAFSSTGIYPHPARGSCGAIRDGRGAAPQGVRGPRPLPNPSPRCPAPVRAESIESKIFPDSQGAMIFDDHRVEVVMRILVLVILAVGVVYRAAPAQAQTYDPNYPVCLQIYDDMVHYYFECRYTSIPQCLSGKVLNRMNRL